MGRLDSLSTAAGLALSILASLFQDLDCAGKALSPVGNALSPEGQTLSPKGKALSPEGMMLSPVGKALSPVSGDSRMSRERRTRLSGLQTQIDAVPGGQAGKKAIRLGSD